MSVEVSRVRRRVSVRGRVQGVFFRASTCEQARALGVDGWVRNRPGGSVEAVFEGEPDRVEAAVAFCRSGPPGARVLAVEVTAEEPRNEAGFSIR